MGGSGLGQWHGCRAAGDLACPACSQVAGPGYERGYISKPALHVPVYTLFPPRVARQPAGVLRGSHISSP